MEITHLKATKRLHKCLRQLITQEKKEWGFQLSVIVWGGLMKWAYIGLRNCQLSILNITAEY